MPTLESVCKRLLSEPTWILRFLLGAILCTVPIAHFLACGYIYEMVNRVRRGEPAELPEWEDWARLFHQGVAAFAIFVVFTVAPLGVAWLLTLPLRVLGAGWFGYLPMAPVLLLCFPLTAASLYLYQKREDYRDAFRPWILARVLRSVGLALVVPTLALVGLLAVGLPLLPFTVFGGFVIAGAVYASMFREVEMNLRAGRKGS
jgi:small-conductance mechanosensitive channel